MVYVPQTEVWSERQSQSQPFPLPKSSYQYSKSVGAGPLETLGIPTTASLHFSLCVLHFYIRVYEVTIPLLHSQVHPLRHTRSTGDKRPGRDGEDPRM